MINAGIVKKKTATTLLHVAKKQIAGNVPLLPTHNMPMPTSANHIPGLASNAGSNFGDFRDQEPGNDYPVLHIPHEMAQTMFEIKDTDSFGVNGMKVGLGVFATTTAWQKGDHLPIFLGPNHGCCCLQREAWQQEQIGSPINRCRPPV